MNNNLFEAFNNGSLKQPAATTNFGTISILPAGIPHEVNAGNEGLTGTICFVSIRSIFASRFSLSTAALFF